MRLLLPIIMALTFTLSGCIKSPLDNAVNVDIASNIHIDPITSTSTATNEDGDVSATNEDGDISVVNDNGVTPAVEAVEEVDNMPAPDVEDMSPREYGAWADVPLPEDHEGDEYEPEVTPPVVVDAGGDPTFATVWADYDILHGLPAPANPLPDIATALSGTVSWTATATGTLNPRAEHLSEPQFKLTWDATKPTALRGDLSFLTTIDDAEKRVTLALYSARLSGLVFKPTYANDPDWDGKGFAGSFGDNTFTGVTGRVKAPYFVGEFAATASD